MKFMRKLMLADIKSRLDRIKELNKIIDGPISTKGEVAHREKRSILNNYESDVEYLLDIISDLEIKLDNEINKDDWQGPLQGYSRG